MADRNQNPGGPDRPAPRAEARPPNRTWPRRLLRISLFSLAGLVALLLLAVLLLPFILTEARLKSVLSAKLSEKLAGRAVSIGSIDFSLWAGRAAVGDLAVANPPGFSRPDLVRVKRIDAQLDLWPAVFSLGKKIHAALIVTDPDILIERNAAGQLNVANLLAPAARPLSFDALFFSLKLTGGRVTVLDSRDPRRETVLRDVAIEAVLPGITLPLTYVLTASTPNGKVSARGRPILFRNGTVDTDRLQGELVDATFRDFPTDALLAVLGAPPVLSLLNGTFSASVDQPGRLRVTGGLTGSAPFEPSELSARFDATVNLTSLDAAGKVTLNLGPTAAVVSDLDSVVHAAVDLDLKRAGVDGLKLLADLRGDLARLTTPQFAKFFRLPPNPDGRATFSQGRLTARIEITGRTTDAVTASATFTATDLQPDKAFTGSVAVPPESAALNADARLTFTSAGRLNELEIPSLTAKGSFFDAEIKNGRVSSLSDLKALGADLAGRVHFSGQAFSAKFGGPLGLPKLHDKLDASFALKGQSGKADFTANARLEREQGDLDLIQLGLAAKLDGTGPTLNATDCAIEMRAETKNERPLYVFLAGTVSDIAGAPIADLQTLSGSEVRVGYLADRFSAYLPALAQLRGSGSTSLYPFRFRGSPQKFSLAFSFDVHTLHIGGPLEKLPPALQVLHHILRTSEFECPGDITADIPNRRIEIKHLRAIGGGRGSDLLTASVKGTITDFLALKGKLDLEVALHTGAAGIALCDLGLAKEPIETKGDIQLKAKIDTDARRVDLTTLSVDTPFAQLKLKDKCAITNLDVDKLKSDPLAAARALALDASLEGKLLLDSLAKLPPALLPSGLKAAGSLPFALEVKQGSDAVITFSADATDTAVEYADLLSKPRGKRVTLKAQARLPRSGGISVPAVELVADGAEVKLAGELDDKLDTFTCRELTAKVTDPAAVAALVPKLKALKPSGRLDLTASGKVPIRDLAAGKLSGLEFKAVVNLRDLGGSLADAPALAFKASGSIHTDGRTLTAGEGLALTATNLTSRRETRLELTEVVLTSDVPGRERIPLLTDSDRLFLKVTAHSPEIDLSDLLAALPQKTQAETNAAPPAAPATTAGNPLDFLKRYRAVVHFTADKLTYDKYTISNLIVPILLSEGRLRAQDQITARLCDGSVQIALDADLTDPAVAHQGVVAFSKIDVNRVASAAASLDDVFRGVAAGTFTWKGKGFSLKDITTHWTGDANVGLDDGVILNFQKFPLVAGIAGPVLEHLGAAAFPQNEFRYKQVDLKLRLEQGRLGMKDLVLNGTHDLWIEIPAASVGFDGSVSASVAIKPPVALAMDYVRKKLVKVPAALPIIEGALKKDRPPFCTFSVAGDFRSPRISTDFTAFPKWVLKTAGRALTDPGSFLDSILKDKTKPPDDKEPGNPPQDPKKKDKKKDPVKSILDELLK